MSMEAVAMVKIPAHVLASQLPAADNEGTNLQAANGETLTISALDDATLVFTGVSMREVEPDDLATVIRTLLGDALDAHGDERGVLVFPKAAAPKERSYDAAVTEVAEMGEWVPVVDAGEDEAGFADVASDLMSQLGPDVLDLQKRMMAGDPSAMQEAMAQVGQMLSDPSKRDALMNAVSAMAGEGSPLAGLADNLPPGMAMPNPADLAANMDMGALQEQAQKMMADNPNLEAELLEKLGKKPKDE